MLEKLLKKIIRRKNINYYINQPLFSEEILATNCYEELQRNGWCDIITDEPDNLIDLIVFKQ